MAPGGTPFRYAEYDTGSLDVEEAIRLAASSYGKERDTEATRRAKLAQSLVSAFAPHVAASGDGGGGS